MTTTAASTDPLSLVGKTLAGHFLVQSLVAEGRTSVVYRGEHVGPKRSVALKCLKISLSLDATRADTFLKRLREETRGYSQVIRNEPNFIRSIGTGMTVTGSGAHLPYAVLEWLDGYSLAQDIKMRMKVGEGGRPLPVVADMLAPIARALASAHVQKFVHGDVASNNLFLAKVHGVSDVKILDFGVAKVMRDVTAELSPSGSATPENDPFFSPTPGYAAPEILNPSLGAAGAWSDVYSFAIVFLEALAGKLIREGSPLPKALGLSLPESVEKVIGRALDPSPKERWPSLGEFWASLEDSLRVSAVAVPVQKDPTSPGMTIKLGPPISAQGEVGKGTVRLPGAPSAPGKILPAAGSKPNPPPAAQTTAMASPPVHTPDPTPGPPKSTSAPKSTSTPKADEAPKSVGKPIVGSPVKMVHPVAAPTPKPAPVVAKVEAKTEAKKPDEKNSDDEKATEPRISPSKIEAARAEAKKQDIPPPASARFKDESKTDPRKSSPEIRQPSSPEIRKSSPEIRKSKPGLTVPSAVGKKEPSKSSPTLPGEGQKTPPLPPPSSAKPAPETNGVPASVKPKDDEAPVSSGVPSSVPPPPPAPGAVVLKAPGPVPAPPPSKPDVAAKSKRSPPSSRVEQAKNVAAAAPARRANVFIEDVPTVIVNDAPPPPKPSERSLKAADPIPDSGYGAPQSQLPVSANLPQMQAHMQMPPSQPTGQIAGHQMYVQSSPHAFVPPNAPPMHHLPPPPPPMGRPGMFVGPNAPLPQQRGSYDEQRNRKKTMTVVVVSFVLAFVLGGVLLFGRLAHMHPAPVSSGAVQANPLSTQGTPAATTSQAAPAATK